MKFLSISKPRDTLSMLPPNILRPLVESALAAMEQQKKEGKILEHYYTANGCSVVILDYASAEQWVQDQNSIPFLRYYDQEIYILSDASQAMKAIIERIKVAEKAMSGGTK